MRRRPEVQSKRAWLLVPQAHWRVWPCLSVAPPDGRPRGRYPSPSSQTFQSEQTHPPSGLIPSAVALLLPVRASP